MAKIFFFADHAKINLIKGGVLIIIGNHMNSSAIWEIIALSHVLEGRVITRGEAEWNLSFYIIHGECNYFPNWL